MDTSSILQTVVTETLEALATDFKLTVSCRRSAIFHVKPFCPMQISGKELIGLIEFGLSFRKNIRNVVYEGQDSSFLAERVNPLMVCQR